MTKLTPRSILAVGGLLLATACGSDSTSTTAAPTSPTPQAAPQDFDLPQGDDPVELDPTDFTVDIDNPYWPMQPGSQWRYSEVDPDGTELEVFVTVTTETKEIANGITARVVRDTVTRDGELIEDTFDWYAQDSAGNIWYLGEDTAEFENGEITTTAGSFEAGVDGALPGIAIPGDAADGMSYRQEFYAGEAEDNGEVLSTEEQVDVPFGHFEGVLLTKDTISIEPDVLEYKLYAPEVGLVMALGVSGGGGREELIDFRTVSDTIAKAAATTPLGENYL